jgi:hypothetical protein
MEQIARPFLTVVTRTMQDRGDFLAINKASVRLQSDHDIQHLIITDPLPQGSGMIWAQAAPMMYVNDVYGQYIMLLDDDDMLLNTDAVRIFKSACSENYSPGVIMFRTWHHDLGILPDNHVWGKQPLLGHIGNNDFIIRAYTWKAYIHNLANGYNGDYEFIKSVFDSGASVVWLDILIAACMQRATLAGKRE